MSRPRGMPRPPGPKRQHDVSAWLRYYQRAEQWYLACAAGLDDFPASQALCLAQASSFGRGVTEVIMGAHYCQMRGTWS